ncbi:MAG: glycosyltransferase, partial [Bifidobacteriaceae bacterium]|nr:glycosyltransferase [Bifidobacteriaceae bacterium]
FPFHQRSQVSEFQRWLYVGNLHRSKGVLDTLELFAAYAQRHPAARLAFVGAGEAEPVLRARVHRLGLAERVEFRGALASEEVAVAMAQADLQVHLSPGETFGLAPLEGLLAGLPVLAARNAGTEQTMGPACQAGRAVLVDRPRGRRGRARALQALTLLAGSAAEEDAALEVRRGIEERYGMAGFGAMLRRVAAGLDPYEAPDAAQPTLAVLALTAGAWDQVTNRVRQALRTRRPVTALLGDTSVAGSLDPRIAVVNLPGPNRTAKWLGRGLYILPAVFFKVLRGGLRGTRRVLKASPRPAAVALRAERACTSAAGRWNAFHRRHLKPLVRRWTTSPRQALVLARIVQSQLPTGTQVVTAPSEPKRLVRQLTH